MDAAICESKFKSKSNYEIVPLGSTAAVLVVRDLLDALLQSG